MERGNGKIRLLAALAGSAVALLAPAAAPADITSVFGGQVACATQSDGTRYCGGSPSTVPTWDGTPIDVNVALPPAPAGGTDGDYPLVMVFHGYGGHKIGFDDLRRWTDQGYAAFSMSDRGFGDSCGLFSTTRITDPLACLNGYVHLMDTRYEVRDAQFFAGELADEGIADPQRIGATGGSYGGGLSMALAALKNRVMMPDGSLVPWTSPNGTPMQIAAAAPEIPWTDLANALAPNGATLDYVADSPYLIRGRIGVMKLSFVAGLYADGLTGGGNYALPGTAPDADLTTWLATVTAGEPYDGNPLAENMVNELTTYHSSYYIDHSEPPAPLLISNGWTDDLFPPDEALRFYNRTRTQYPNSPIGLTFMDFGHMRGQNKAADLAWLAQRENAWFAYYLKGQGSTPSDDVEVKTTTCPSSAPSGGPFSAPDWAQIAPGEIRFDDADSETILPLTGDPTVGLAFDPIAGQGACAKTSSADEISSVDYRLPAAPAGGYTLMGSATVIADITSPGATSQIAARLLDQAPDGTQTLVARGLWRPAVTNDPLKQVFQMHPDGYHFDAGHIAKLELLPNDVPYGRLSNLQLPVTVSNLELRLPVLEQPGSLGGMVQAPAPKDVPEGYSLASDYTRANGGPGGAPLPSPLSSSGSGSAGTKGSGNAKKCKKHRHGKRARHCKRRKHRHR